MTTVYLYNPVRGRVNRAGLFFGVPDRSPTSLNPFRTLQRHRNFRLFWFGQTLSLIGTWMHAMSEGWLALEISNNAFLVGLVASAQSFPILLLSVPAGVVIDRT